MTEKRKIMVIGGSAAGPKAAAKARRIDNDAQVVILQKDADLSMASCGYPYYVGGFFNDRNQLLCTPAGAVRNPMFYLNAKDIEARVNTEVTAIDRKNKTLSFRNLASGETGTLPYDKLVIATGAVPRMPPVPGVELAGITTLQSMKDADFLRNVRDEGKIKKAVVIGGGLIGIETCEALQLAGIEITVIELLPQLLTFLDWELAQQAGLKIGELGGIDVNAYMQTSDPDIYAVGDCVETTSRITGKKVLAPYGDLANLQGRVAGENAASTNCVTFPGTIQTGICKVFDYAAGSTGLSETAARKLGYTDIVTVINASPDKPGFMEGKLLVTKMTADAKTGRILGAQCIGPGNVAKQIAQWAMAIQGKMTVEDLVNADLPYAPPFSLAIDHFIATAHLMQNKIKGRLKGISCHQVHLKVLAGEKPFLIDTRGPEEFEEMRLGIGETLIPLGALRKRLKELPEDKNREIICYCKISLRGYEAALALEANGWKNVKVMEGGIMAWPYPREK